MMKNQEKPGKLIQAEKLIDESKLEEALTLLNNYVQKEGLKHYDKISCQLLQCQILFWQGKNKELIKHTEHMHKESGGWENKLFTVDNLLIMTHALVKLNRFDEASDLIKQGEELIKTLPQKLSKAYKQREAYLAFINGYYYNKKYEPSNADLSLEYLEHSLALREELGIKHEIAESLSAMAYNLCFFKGEMNRALINVERSLVLAKESSKKYYIATSLYIIAMIYAHQGELDRSIRFYGQCLAFYKEVNNKERIAYVLNNLSYNYKIKGELDRALECIEQAMALNRELGALRALANNHDFLIQILIDKGDIERAQISLHDFEQLNSQLKEKNFDLTYLFDKALVLKASPRIRNWGKAEELLKQVLEEEDLNYQDSLTALLNLCELLLIELRLTNELEVMEEINQFIIRLLEITERSHSYLLLCETHLLQAKLSLLTFDIQKAKRFLTQAQQIAERFDLTQLTTKIAKENDDLLKKEALWEKLKVEGAPMADRVELARLDEQIEGMVQKRAVLTIQVTEERVAISKEIKICLVCRGDVLRFSYICECGAIYCGNCAQALTDLENVCWACDIPIDFSKSVKHFKEEEEEMEKLREEAKKKCE